MLSPILPITFSINLVNYMSLMLFLYGMSSCALLGDNALNLLLKHPLIDGHNDLALQLRILHNNNLSRIDLHDLSRVATDINRLQAGGVGVQVFAAYVLCRAQEKDAVRLTLEQVDVIRRMCSKYPELELATSVQELKDSAMRKKIACLISIEGGHSIDSSLPTLRMFYQLGVRSMALTHNCNTPWAESSSTLYNEHQRKDNSLTHFGKAVVEEMNRLGMIIDLSHSSWATTSAVLKRSKAPVIFSHSSAHAVCNHSRNVPDQLLRDLKLNSGLIMVNLHSGFVACSSQANVANVADHFDHIRAIVGADSIGIGADFEGALNFPLGLKDVSTYPYLIQELLLRNWTEDELSGVLRLNFLRVFEAVEKVRDQLSDHPPSEMEIPMEEVHHPCRLDLKALISQARPRFDSLSASQAPIAPQNNLLWTALLLIFLYFNGNSSTCGHI